jgi:8-oxo-dGTP pyrophosphatase MutT (NUDIX family)
MMLKTLKEVLKDYPEYQKEWNFDGKIENKKGFGSINSVVVCDDNGKPIYDTYYLEEKKGVSVIPYDIKNGKVRVGLIKEKRILAGKKYISIPRGFREKGEKKEDAAKRELLEEAGLRSLEIKEISQSNPDTVHSKKSSPLFVIKVKDLENTEGHNTEEIEEIEKVKAYTFSDLKKIDLECGIAKAALFDFICFMPEFLKS